MRIARIVTAFAPDKRKSRPETDGRANTDGQWCMVTQIAAVDYKLRGEDYSMSTACAVPAATVRTLVHAYARPGSHRLNRSSAYCTGQLASSLDDSALYENHAVCKPHDRAGALRL